MGTMITHHGYNNGYNNPMHNMHRNVGARYTWQNTVYNSVLFSMFVKLCNHHHYPILEHSTPAPHQNPIPISSYSPFPAPLHPGNHYTTLSLWIYLPVPVCHINGVTQYVALCVCLLSLSTASPRTTHACGGASSSLWLRIYGIFQGDILLFHPVVNGYLGCSSLF